MVESVTLASITVYERFQPRRDGIDTRHVEALMESAESWPPITLAQRDGGLILIDGFHRIDAANRLGLISIGATVIDPPPDGDYFRLAFELNASHGRPLTLADRKAYATDLLDRNSELSDREIGRRTGLHRETVGDLRRAAGTWRVPIRKPGDIEPDVGVLDPIRRARNATRAQKAIAGYIKRILDGIEEPYVDDAVEGWCDDPVTLAQACVAAMGSERASRVLRSLEYRARFLAQIGKAHKSLPKSPEGGRT